MNEVLLIPICNSTPSTKDPKPVNEVSDVKLDDELEALCQDTEYLLSDQDKKEVRHLLWPKWELFKLGRTLLVKYDINHHGRANETNS